MQRFSTTAMATVFVKGNEKEHDSRLNRSIDQSPNSAHELGTNLICGHVLCIFMRCDTRIPSRDDEHEHGGAGLPRHREGHRVDPVVQGHLGQNVPP